MAKDPKDGRLLVPMSVISNLSKNASAPQERKEGNSAGVMTTNFGAELTRRIEAGTAEDMPFEYDEQGKYIGARVNGKVMAPEQLTQPHNDGLCLVCNFETTKRCATCKIACYCSVSCQASDWAHHKVMCGRMLLNSQGQLLARSEQL